MSKIKVHLETGNDCATFVGIATGIEEPVYLEDANGLVVNAKSLMGVMYGKCEFTELWVKSENPNLASKFIKFII